MHRGDDRARPVEQLTEPCRLRSVTQGQDIGEEVRPEHKEQNRRDDDPFGPGVSAIELEALGEVESEEHHRQRPQIREDRLIDRRNRVEPFDATVELA